ncbi:ester cyclase [Rhodovibrionaceae bacterium A322]
MERPQDRKLIETWFERVWKQEDPSAIDELFIDARVEGLGAQPHVTPEQFKQFHAAICALATNHDITIDRYHQQGDWVSIICTIRATGRETGQPIAVTGSMWMRIEDNRLAEAYNHIDFLSYWSQLGLLPADSFERALMGQQIA